MDKVWIDADLTKDTNGDGDTKNDADSLDLATTYGIKKGNTLSNFEIGPFNILFTKKIRFFAEDGNGNISSKDLTLTVYPPIPEIRSLSGNRISGNLSEILGDEPIDIFRLRNGALARIEPTASDLAKTRTDGTFTLPASEASGLVLTQSGQNVATIDERTGKIALEDTSFQISVVPASNNSPFRIQVLSPINNVVFSETIDISTVSHIEQATTLDAVSGTGIFISPATGFSFAKNTLSSPSLPNGGYITDTSHKAIAGISKSGDIYILNTKYKLSYATRGSYILLRVQDSEQNIVANILYKIHAEYVLK